MKKITEQINNLSTSEKNILLKILSIKKTDITVSIIQSRLLSYHGLFLIIKSLTIDELNVFSTTYNEKDGITFGELEKITGLTTASIEEISKRLSSLFLSYVLKNRQRLHNKLDKIYIYPEVRKILKTISFNKTVKHTKSIIKSIKKNEFPAKNPISEFKKHSNELKIINALFKNSGIITFEEALRFIPEGSIEKLLVKLKQNKFIDIYYDLNSPCTMFIFLSKEIYLHLIYNNNTLEIENKYRVHNHFSLILNILNTYDIISTYGLFLTRQNKFRKIDKKRLQEAMQKIYDINGIEFSHGKISKLILHILYTLDILKISNFSTSILLNQLTDDLNNPAEILYKILSSLDSSAKNKLFFPSPIFLPSLDTIQEMIYLFFKYNDRTMQELNTIYILNAISKNNNKDFNNLTILREKSNCDFKHSARFLCLCGIIDIYNGRISLSDIGYKISEMLLKIKKPNDEEEHLTKNIYINPDFTMIIPKLEIPSEELYHIISHSEIFKEDVILNARITKNSILKAQKRGMSPEKFIDSLNRYSKTVIPQNLNFLIKEWYEQTIHINICNPTLLYCNKTGIIDEISYSDIKSSIIKKISENFAIIDRKKVDNVIKFARKKDAVIKLLEDFGADEDKSPTK